MAFHLASQLHASGRSCTVDLCLNGPRNDPTFEALRNPIFHLLAMTWNHKDLNPMILRTLGIAIHAVNISSIGHTYKLVQGPVSAFVYAIYSISLSFSPDMANLISANEQAFEWARVSPRTIDNFVLTDVSHYLWTPSGKDTRSMHSFRDGLGCSPSGRC